MTKYLVKFTAIAILIAALAGCSSTSSSSNTTVGAPASSFAGIEQQVRFTPWSGQSAVGQLAKPYFISFRARNAESYGHSFVAFGELDFRGSVPYDNGGVLISDMTEIAGLHPAGGNAAYSMGHIAPVPSETGFSDGDTEIRYLQNEMTIALTPEEYKRIVGRIRQLQGSSPLWHAVAYNCSSFTNKIADFMGMETVNHLLFPRNYIAALKDANPGVQTLSRSVDTLG
ncbi:hypothetical protein VQ042_24225 [Aurantimonas sp. A2-1-M11]|uniref:hypothetical protein n=1 Tax=Aurantimonas sp. A2-1-M11 TaxID=3113712 RepID=UPI002F936B47